MERTQADVPPEAPPPHTARQQYGRPATDAQVRRMLGEMADRLERNRPGEALTEIGLLALVQATTPDPVLSRALRARIPEVTGRSSVVRRDFSAQLRELAAVPLCCGRPMVQDGEQDVCRSCGAWADRGAAPASEEASDG
ncbi:hypothetical protein ACIPSJ_01615 [Streptomyces sp. NPDC090088]|uniref:hypothetical protein n=1 Tax=Streptomyces sp. NPDC090088 TaxID=3365944 RepID=UPI0038235293